MASGWAVCSATRVMKSALLLSNDILFLIPASTALLVHTPCQPRMYTNSYSVAMRVSNCNYISEPPEGYNPSIPHPRPQRLIGRSPRNISHKLYTESLNHIRSKFYWASTHTSRAQAGSNISHSLMQVSESGPPTSQKRNPVGYICGGWGCI